MSDQQYRSQAPQSLQSFTEVSFARPLNPELFSGVAQRAATAIAAAKEKHNKSTQLRRFYDELVMWEMRVAQDESRFEENLPFIRMLNAKAAYAKGRDLVDQNFVQLLSQTLKETQCAATLATCKLFWEAFMGFYKQERGNY